MEPQEDVMKILGFSALALAALAATVVHADAACFYHYATDGYGNLYLVLALLLLKLIELWRSHRCPPRATQGPAAGGCHEVFRFFRTRPGDSGH
jgi:drug/metabolite transporter superfamily protein YnfA